MSTAIAKPKGGGFPQISISFAFTAPPLPSGSDLVQLSAFPKPDHGAIRVIDLGVCVLLRASQSVPFVVVDCLSCLASREATSKLCQAFTKAGVCELVKCVR